MTGEVFYSAWRANMTDAGVTLVPSWGSLTAAEQRAWNETARQVVRGIELGVATHVR